MVKRDISVAAPKEYGFSPESMEETTRSLASFVTVVSGGLSVSALVLWIWFPPPSPATLSWHGLALFAAIYIAATVALHLVGLGILYWLLGGQLELPIGEIARRSWPATVWMPLWTLSGHQHSPWVAVISIVIAAQTAVCLRHLVGNDGPEADTRPMQESLLSGAGYGQRTTGKGKAAFLTAIAFQCGLGLFLLGQYMFSGVWLAGAIVYPIWKLSQRRPERLNAATRARNALRWTAKLLLPVALTACALVPYAKNAAIAAAFARWLGLQWSGAQPTVKMEPLHRGSSFSGIILMPPVKPVKHLVAPSPASAVLAVGKVMSKPIEIEFDGVYWYFEPADDGPLADAPKVRGDASKSTIRSTHDAPVAMVANQSLGEAISMRCCRSMRVEVVSREDSLGPVLLEVILRDASDRKGARSVSLGNVLAASTATHRLGAAGATDETLTFPFPKSEQLDSFNAITVAIKPLHERAPRGAHIAIQRFVLMP